MCWPSTTKMWWSMCSTQKSASYPPVFFSSPIFSECSTAQQSTAQKVKNTIYTKRYSYSSSAGCRIRNNINIRYVQVDSIQQFSVAAARNKKRWPLNKRWEMMVSVLSGCCCRHARKTRGFLILTRGKKIFPCCCCRHNNKLGSLDKQQSNSPTCLAYSDGYRKYQMFFFQ